MRIGSLFSGIGGLDLAVEAATGGRVVWHCERDAYCRRVLARHWPDAELFDDVVGLSGLPEVDVLVGGFPCQDLSSASQTKTGLAGKRSGLFYELVRIVGEVQPAVVVIENVPALLKWRPTVDAEFAALGYRCRWARLYASNAGAPHYRRRVFIVATRSEGFELSAPMMDLPRGSSRPWPTPTCGDARASGSRSLPSSDAHAGASLTDAVRPDRKKPGHWPTPTVAIATGGQSSRSGTRKGERLLSGMARDLWPTPKTRDYKSGTGTHEGNLPERQGSRDLPELLGGRLDPRWVAQLMGFVDGWIEPEGDPLTGYADRWPAGPADEQHAWESPRLMFGKPMRGRPAMLRALGNAVVPQQAMIALEYLLPQTHKATT